MPVREIGAFGGETAEALCVWVRLPEPLDTSNVPLQLEVPFQGEPNRSGF